MSFRASIVGSQGNIIGFSFDKIGFFNLPAPEPSTSLSKQNLQSQKRATNLPSKTVALMIQSTGLAERVIRQSLVAFDIFDRNGDGFIDRSSLKSALEKCGVKLNDTQLNRVILSADNSSEDRWDIHGFVRVLAGIQDTPHLYDVAEHSTDTRKRWNVHSAWSALGGAEDCTGTVPMSRVRSIMMHFGIWIDIGDTLETLTQGHIPEDQLDYGLFQTVFSENFAKIVKGEPVNSECSPVDTQSVSDEFGSQHFFA